MTALNPAEERFREAVRRLVRDGAYPSNAALLHEIPPHARANPRSGLSPNQVRWREEEMRRAGYAWGASQKLHQLVRSGSTGA